MNLIIYLIAGAIVGYVASRIMHTNSQQGLILIEAFRALGRGSWFTWQFRWRYRGIRRVNRSRVTRALGI